jgi:starch synthase
LPFTAAVAPSSLGDRAAIDHPPRGAIIPLVRRLPRVLFVASEMGDFAQAGGLGEVASSLPRAMKPHADVRILMPGYGRALARASALELVVELPGAGDIPACSVARTTVRDGTTVYLVLCPELYERDGQLYVDSDGVDWPDNDIRFARLSLAAAQMASALPDWRADLLHLNDWQTALAAGYLTWSGVRTPALLTVHNLAHQGLFDASRRTALAIPEHAFGIDGVEFHGRISFLKAGLNYASAVATVSETYAAEISTPAGGCGLEGLVAKCASEGRITGILNGIDDSWDPRKDQLCPYEFDAKGWKGRYADFIRGSFGLSLVRRPLFAVVSRLVHQKGADRVLAVVDEIVRAGGQLVVMGHGEPTYERAFRQIAANARHAIGVRIGFDSEQARAIFAAADFLLMPSRFEPCGLSQMYAQRFGAIPVATRTGGLAETIEDGKTGLLFDGEFEGAFPRAIGVALEIHASSQRLSDMRRAAMARRFDWAHSARRYNALYERALRSFA